MSFGWGVGDIIAISALAVKVHTAYQDAPDDYRHFSGEVRLLEVMINKAKKQFTTLSNEKQMEGQLVLESCQTLLEDLNSLVGKYKSLDSTNNKLDWNRIRFFKEDIAPLRQRLILNMGFLSDFVRSCEHEETKALVSIHRTASRDSVISLPGSINTKRGYKEFCKSLYQSGITPTMLSQNQKGIFKICDPQNTVTGGINSWRGSPRYETAGLPLELFPLVIEVITTYTTSAKRFKQIVRYTRTLDRFRRCLEMESTIYGNTWYMLVLRAGVHIEGLKPTISMEVLSYLPLHVRESFVDAAQELNIILRTLAERFQRNQALTKLRLLGYPSMRERYECLDRIHRLNFNLSNLVHGLQMPMVKVNKLQKDVTTVKANKLQKDVRHYKRVRKDAITLYGALREGFQVSHCRCNMHNAMLQLDLCNVGTHNSHYKTGRLNIWFPFLAGQDETEECITLRQLEFENIENPDPKVPALEYSQVPGVPEQTIECLCSTSQNITEMGTCVGVLVSNNSKHQVWVPRAPLTSVRVAPLAKLLTLPEPPMMERLMFAVRLASSALQLHKTEWLQGRCDKHDIYFIQGNSSQSRSPSLETPVVRHTFTSEPPALEALIGSHTLSRNLSLFSLGIVLIELWFWRSVESFQADIPQAGDQDTARYITAARLIERLNEGAGIEYGSSVRRCIYGLDHWESQLENNEFKGEAYIKVLKPLEKSLEIFCGETLEKTFEKDS